MRKIFIIEDEQDIIQAVHDELKKWGYDVTGVSDWDNMMAEVKEADPVLILMDITLPMYDGFTGRSRSGPFHRYRLFLFRPPILIKMP